MRCEHLIQSAPRGALTSTIDLRTCLGCGETIQSPASEERAREPLGPLVSFGFQSVALSAEQARAWGAL